MGFSMERMIEVWDDDRGERIEIGPDRDGLDLVELRVRDRDDNITNRFVFHPEQARAVGLAMAEVASNLMKEGT